MASSAFQACRPNARRLIPILPNLAAWLRVAPYNGTEQLWTRSSNKYSHRKNRQPQGRHLMPRRLPRARCSVLNDCLLLKWILHEAGYVELRDGFTPEKAQRVLDLAPKDLKRFGDARFTRGSEAIGIRAADEHRFCSRR